MDMRLERIEKLLLGSKRVLTLDEASEYAGISRSYLYKLTSQGKIPHSKPNGKLIFFDMEKLNSWLLRNRRQSDSELEEQANAYILRKGR